MKRDKGILVQAGLIMHLAMDEGNGSHALDGSGWGNDGELGSGQRSESLKRACCPKERFYLQTSLYRIL